MRTISWLCAAGAAFFCATAAHASVPLPKPRPIVVAEWSGELCLARVIYEEARGESWEGQLTVAFVTKMRARLDRPDWGGRTLCGVAGHFRVVNGEKTRQYSGVKDLGKWMPADKQAWARAIVAAQIVLRGEYVPPGELRYATYYLVPKDSGLKGRCWFDRELIPIAKVGRHLFYREPLPEEAATLRASVMPPDCPSTALASR